MCLTSSEAGYSIAIALVDNDPEMAKQRSLSRFMKGGRYAPDSYIEARVHVIQDHYMPPCCQC